MMDNDLIDDQPSAVVSPPTKTVGLADKEKPPLAVGPEVQPVPAEPEIGPELKEIGVEAVVQPKLRVDQQLEELGVRRRGAAAASLPPTATTLPLTDDQILAGQNQSITSSWRWLAAWCIRQLQKAGLALKRFHGQVLRIKNRYR